MTGDFASDFYETFLRMINCSEGEHGGFLPLGFTRTGELEPFVDAIMQAWTTSLDSQLQTFSQSSLELRDNYFPQRYCTYKEFEELFTAPIKNVKDEPVFRILGIQDEENQNTFKRRFSKDRDCYFKLMEIINPEMWDFFFRLVQPAIPISEFEKHTYVVGATGSGKSEIIKNLVWENIKRDQAAIIILDPKGDLSRDIAKFVDHTYPHRRDKLVYLSPFDFTDQTPILNPLELPPHPKEEHEILVRLTTQELERTLHNIFSELDSGFTGQMRSVLSPCLETLIRKGDADLWDLMRFMDDNLNSDLVSSGCESPNPAVRLFFTHNFPGIGPETRKGIEWRCRNLLKSQVFAGLTTGKSTVHLRQLINERKCIIFNLDKGNMGTDVSSHFGKLVVSLVQVIAMQRGGKPDASKIPIHFYIDEFHNYVTQSIKEVLAEARSNKLFLTLAQQIVGQGVSERDFKKVLMGNTNIKILAKSSVENYKELSGEFGIEVERLLQLPKFYYYVKIGHGKTFRVKGLSGLVKDKNAMSEDQWKETVQEQLAHYYVSPNKAIEARKKQETTWAGSYLERQKKISSPAKRKAKNEGEQPDKETIYPF